jgi:hypothetical protein
VREMEATPLHYWRLVRNLELVRGSDVVTGEEQFVDADGNLYMHGELVGRKRPSRPGWAAWGLEAAGRPWSPPPAR